MKVLSTFAILFILTSANAQILVRGTVADKKGEAISGANIYFEGSYDGTTSGSEGNFELTSELSSKRILVVSYIGYKNFTQEISSASSDTFLNTSLIPNTD